MESCKRVETEKKYGTLRKVVQNFYWPLNVFLEILDVEIDDEQLSRDEDSPKGMKANIMQQIVK